MSAARNKTLRKSPSDLSGVSQYSFNDSLEQMLNAEADKAYRKPWHRLERGLRLNRLRAFSESLATLRGFKPIEQQNLLTLLTKALDKKLLNSKTSVVYDDVKEEITEIKPLVMHQNANGEVLFQIIERRNAVTFRKRPSSADDSTPV
uniref:Uncharacterized protein n=1 Tax=viral metagenome TaxID=1070528 RepID=A0A6C0JZX0_9ZZZZ